MKRATLVDLLMELPCPLARARAGAGLIAITPDSIASESDARNVLMATFLARLSVGIYSFFLLSFRVASGSLIMMRERILLIFFSRTHCLLLVRLNWGASFLVDLWGEKVARTIRVLWSAGTVCALCWNSEGRYSFWLGSWLCICTSNVCSIGGTILTNELFSWRENNTDTESRITMKLFSATKR